MGYAEVEELKRALVEAFEWVEAGPAGEVVSDPAGWWRDPALLTPTVSALADPFRDAGVTVVIGPESRGFLLGGLVARELGAGFVEAYKHGTPSAQTLVSRTPFGLTLAVRARLLGPADRVLIVDDWVETGAQLDAVRLIVAAARATLAGASVIVDGREATAGQADIHALVRLDELR